MTDFRENKDVRRPFLSTPTPSVYFPGSTIEKARRATSRCLRRDEGVALVVGSTGVGKTLLARVLASEFDADALVAFVSPRRRLDVKSFFQQFLFGLRQTFCGCDETELRLMAFDYLERASQERCVLLVDDAQNLTLRVLDEIRGLIDQCAASTKRLSVALFGLSSLEERLNLPSLFPFQQRVVSRAYLENFSRAEIAKYVDRELKRAYVNARFSKSAIERIARLSDGSPRVVNQLCDRALFLAFGGEESESFDELNSLKSPSGSLTERVEIDQKDVERAWARLQSLPEEDEDREAENVNPQGNDSTSVVEFGLLDDDEADEYNKGIVTSTKETPETIASDELATTSDASATKETIDAGLNRLEETSQAEAVDELAEETPESVADSVVVPKPFDWEADRYGSIEESAPKETVETGEDVSTSYAKTEEVENVVEPIAVTNEDGEKGEEKVESIPQEEKTNNLTNEARRMRAKQAFWGDDDVQDAFQASASSPSFVEVAQEKVEQAEEVEETEPEGEIDYELDARLREKFGAAIDSNLTNEEASKDASEESVKELLPPEIDLDGMRFEPRGGAEFVARSDLSESVVKSARKTLRPRSFLSAKLSARSVHTPQAEPSATSESDSETFDASLELTPGATATLTTPKAKTRRPLQKDDDGSREFREVNGFAAEESARFAADDRHLESQFAAFPQDSPLRSWGVSDEAQRSGTLDHDERAYRQIVASCYRSASDFPASAQYLNELQLLEQEIAEEANLIRRIRNIHLRLRSVRSSDSDGKNAQDAELSESTSALVTK